MSLSSPGITLDRVGVRFAAAGKPEHTVLEQFDLCCAPGEFLGFVGASGCGKSTLLRVIAGLQRPTAGDVRFPGMEPELAARPRLGFVFQMPNLLPWRDVDANIGLPLELAGCPRPTRLQAVAVARQLVGLAGADAHKRPAQLSGGMQMRVSLARALVTEPQVMLLDEPFAALDDVIRQQLNEDLRRLWKTHGWTTVFVTHNVSEAVYLCDRILVLAARGGRIAAEVHVPWQANRPDDLRARADFAHLCGQVSDSLRRTMQ